MRERAQEATTKEKRLAGVAFIPNLRANRNYVYIITNQKTRRPVFPNLDGCRQLSRMETRILAHFKLHAPRWPLQIPQWQRQERVVGREHALRRNEHRRARLFRRQLWNWTRAC